MKMQQLFLVTALLLCWGCNKKEGKGGDEEKPAIDKAAILAQVKATRMLNDYNDEGCYVYYLGGVATAPEATMGRSLSTADKHEGRAAFKLDYRFTGKSMSAAPEAAFLEQNWADYRPDLGFHPLGVSLWVKGRTGQSDALRLVLIQDETLQATRDQRAYFQYTDATILSSDSWQQLVIPYEAFTRFKSITGRETLQLNRVVGYRIEVVSSSQQSHTGSFLVDQLEQYTNYDPSFSTPQFSSIFIQLGASYAQEDWRAAFRACKEVNIDTWIIQYSHGYGSQNNISWYSNTAASWNTVEYPIIDSMVAAAEETGFKLIFGLYGGDYGTDISNASVYNNLYERNKIVLDELYDKFAASPSFAGWYITEEFHDGTYPVGWHKDPARGLLANYLQRVAAHAKSKARQFPVQIAPALFRGMPADKCGEWFKTLFQQTPDIDFLYLQDIGGRCFVDIDVDLPNYFAEIKKACIETGVEFGVDIESFQYCWCPDVPYHAKEWEEVKEQLLVAGLFTSHITNFSWLTFKPGLNSFEGYKAYLKANNLIN
ncbi:MAG: DUF4434 domain-containing protein [Candidatus Pseudobacter hemicellulosilyticus]|uniref:DUF4434 domain-containing protein n=1 Tax=Candidatus Pseudobacter hemicellulosilyticus TaxID=3121375 RepID=A0AAJ5WRW2_9BACT|nr:MAG: DUF4434 domain-containing protein [Pseudobacter sp.]